jgi:DNA-binding NtrC family response regulator
MTEGARRRVLLAEDEPALASFYCRALRDADFDVDLVTDGAQALKCLQERQYAVLVTDVHMPQMTGIELLREVHARYPEIPVVVMTGQHDAQLFGEARDLGSARYLIKPLRMEQLARAVRNACEARPSRLLPQAPTRGL